jgi:hypothetical protein
MQADDTPSPSNSESVDLNFSDFNTLTSMNMDFSKIKFLSSYLYP